MEFPRDNGLVKKTAINISYLVEIYPRKDLILSEVLTKVKEEINVNNKYAYLTILN